MASQRTWLKANRTDNRPNSFRRFCLVFLHVPRTRLACTQIEERDGAVNFDLNGFLAVAGWCAEIYLACSIHRALLITYGLLRT